MNRLDGKIAFVTAAGGAIAGATARLFAAVDVALGPPEVVPYTPSARIRGELAQRARERTDAL